MGKNNNSSNENRPTVTETKTIDIRNINAQKTTTKSQQPKINAAPTTIAQTYEFINKRVSGSNTKDSVETGDKSRTHQEDVEKSRGRPKKIRTHKTKQQIQYR